MPQRDSNPQYQQHAAAGPRLTPRGYLNNNNNNVHKWYTHIPKPVYEEGDVTVLWNQAVHTVREVTANRPDSFISIQP